ncbi:MAG: HAMP domain-containing sensor histidine kinase [Balneolaceae bacterium]|nr:HAMP domain-containing sensor histidine kinase [Balneolaceae bacterium]
MDKIVKNLISGYETPALVTDASAEQILHANAAARQALGIEPECKARLEELFTPHRVIRGKVVWERMNQYYHIHKEKVALNDRDYLRVSMTPVPVDSHFDFFELQREMSRLLVHRLHSPLNGVTGYTELLGEQLQEGTPLEYLQEIEKGLDDFKSILADIHDLAKDLTVQITSFQVRRFIDSTLKEFPASDRERISVTIARDVEELESDFVLLQDIVTELLRNALDHGDDPEGLVSLEIAGPLSIRVTNYGTPLPEDYVKKIFFPFFSNKARGVGLGLPRCVAYAREMGYSVLLQKNSEEGITFEVRMRPHTF